MTDKRIDLLTEEEKFRLELLADGELDEESRRALLLRLEETGDGWRECAMVFLEAQCLRESFKTKEYLAAQGIMPENPVRISKEENLPSIRKRNRLVLKRNVWISALVSSACGFAAAFCLIGYLEGERNLEEFKEVVQNELPVSRSSEAGRETFSAAESVRSEDLEDLLKTGMPGSAGGMSVLNSQASINGLSSEAADQTEVAAEGRTSDNGVKHIILRRSGESDGISVPCVAVDSYSSDSKTADTLAEGLRKNGCGVETLHEELKFPLKDGKTLIVPVDTINVRRPSDFHFL